MCVGGRGGIRRKRNILLDLQKYCGSGKSNFVHVLSTYGSLIHLSHMCFLLPFAMTCAFAENQLFLLLLNLSLEALSVFKMLCAHVFIFTSAAQLF